jgi:hypothetical protein
VNSEYWNSGGPIIRQMQNSHVMPLRFREVPRCCRHRGQRCHHINKRYFKIKQSWEQIFLVTTMTLMRYFRQGNTGCRWETFWCQEFWCCEVFSEGLSDDWCQPLLFSYYLNNSASTIGRFVTATIFVRWNQWIFFNTTAVKTTYGWCWMTPTATLFVDKFRVFSQK